MRRRTHSERNKEEIAKKSHRTGRQRDSIKDRQAAIVRLSSQVGNRAVQRLVPSGSDRAAFELDDELSSRIERTRGSGGSLDKSTQSEMGSAYGWDFKDVRVHTGQEADQINRELNSRAFTTGRDIYFRDGAYEPGSSDGRRLLSHELAHVVQQGSGAVTGGEKMTVHAPDDRFERQADVAAEQAEKSKPMAPSDSLQMQAEANIQMQEEEEEELQMQELEEEEELQMQVEDEEEELMQ